MICTAEMSKACPVEEFVDIIVIRRTAERTGPITKWPASILPVRNRLCYHFSLYQTNESCSQSDIRRMVLLRSLNKLFLRVTAPNVVEDERPFYAWFCT